VNSCTADTLENILPAGPIAFSGAVVDRADHLRANPQALAELAARGRLLRLDGLDPLLVGEGALAWGRPEEAGEGAELLFLGLAPDGVGCFAAAPPASAASVAPAGPGLWQALASMAPEDLALYGTARSLGGWHARHRFCPRCGSPTGLARGGWQRNCLSAACRAEHYPRTDPVAIMTVEHEGALLLGRQPRFPQRFFSALAGFVEPGETLEEAVAREVWEEAGVRVAEVRYVTSQPWPFPSSLMLGCHAIATTRELRIDSTELEEARWFTRAEVAEAMAAGDRGEAGQAFIAPQRRAVAWHLVYRWLEGGPA
jgi:NAD+ diphosphatase